MIYEASEIVQLVVLVVCFALALIRALRARNAVQLEVACFFACMLLGNVYYYGFVVVFDDFPHYSYIADLSWIAGYVFLLMLMIQCEHERGPVAPIPAAWIPVGVSAACCAAYIYVNGYPLLNLADNGLVAALGFFAVRGLVARPEEELAPGLATSKPLHAAVFAFFVVEQALWLSSLIPDAGPDYVVYTAFNYALTLIYAAILACSWRHDGL